MPQRLTSSDQLLLAISVLVLIPAAASCVGAEWCRHDYYCGDPHAQQYQGDCAANGIGMFRDIVYCWFHTYRDDINAFATAILAFFTVVLAIAARQQAILTRQAVETAITQTRHAERAVNAAMRQADAAVGVEFPRLVLKSVEMPGLRDDPRRVLHSGRLDISFVNHGRTDAVIAGEGYSWKISDHLRLTSDDPVYENLRRADLGTVITPSSPYDMEVTIPGIVRWENAEAIRLEDDEIQKILRGQRHLWIYGFVRYKDFLAIITLTQQARLVEWPYQTGTAGHGEDKSTQQRDVPRRSQGARVA